MADYLYVKGKAKYARLVVPEVYQDDTSWKITLYPDKDSLEELRKLQARGIKNTMRLDDDGFHMQFKRPKEKKKASGGMLYFDPPKCFDKDGIPLDGRTIGNGSDVTVKLDVYGNPTGPRKYLAARLDSVRVDNLIVYNPDKEYTADEAKAADGLMTQPEPLF